MKLNEELLELLKTELWYIATYDQKPNVVPVAFKEITEDLQKVGFKANLKQNRQIAISVSDGKTLKGYQIKGTAEHITEGLIVETFKRTVENMFGGTVTAKGALVITPEPRLRGRIAGRYYKNRYKKKLERIIEKRALWKYAF